MASPLPEPFELVDVLGDGEVLTCLAEFKGSEVLVHVLPADPAERDRLITRINRLPRNPDFLDRLDHQGHSLIVTRHKPELESFEAWLDEHSPEAVGPGAPAADEPGEMTRLVLSIKEAVEEDDAEEEDESATRVMESFHMDVDLDEDESEDPKSEEAKSEETDEGATQVMESFHVPAEPEPPSEAAPEESPEESPDEDRSTRVMESFEAFTAPGAGGEEEDDDATRAMPAPDRDRPDRDTVERPAQQKTEPAFQPPAAFSREVTQEREKPAEEDPKAGEGEKRKTQLFLSATPPGTPAASSSAGASGSAPREPAASGSGSAASEGRAGSGGGGSDSDKTAVKRKPTLEPASTGPDPRLVGAILLAVALVVAVVVVFLG